EAGAAGEHLTSGPHLVIAHNVVVGVREPLSIIATGRLLGLVNTQHHGAEEGRLRAGEEISAVGVQDGAVVVDFVEEVLHHAAGEIELTGAQQAADDEVAVPAVHLVEGTAGHNGRIRQVEQAGLLDPGQINGAEALDRLGEGLDPDLATLANLARLAGMGMSAGTYIMDCCGNFSSMTVLQSSMERVSTCQPLLM